MTGARVTAVAVALGALIRAAPAGAQECDGAARAWVDACGARSGVELDASRCPEQRLIVGAPALEVEIRRGDGGLRAIGPYAVSPVGEFADWAAEPAGRRAAFDAVAACVRDVAPPLAGAGVAPPPRRAASDPAWPILFVLALAGACALATSARPPRRRLAELAALTAVTLVVRALLVPFAFFHQNGQGAMWIEYAAVGHGGLDAYGPGYRELFSLLAGAFGARADTGVFAAQAVLGALVPALAWIVARRAGARASVCWAIAAIVAIDPSLARVAQSESYFGVLTFSLALACAAAVEGGHRGDLRGYRPWLGFAVAGLVVAQAARVHPVVFLPAALVPIAVLALPNPSLRARALRAAACAGVIGAVVAATSAAAIADVLRSDVVPARLGARVAVPPVGWILAMVAGVCVCAWQLGRDAAALTAPIAAAVVVGVMLAANPLPYDVAAFQHPIDRLYWPVLVACAGAVAGRVDVRAAGSARAAYAIAAVVVAAGAIHAAVRWQALTLRATDVRESQWVRTWRDDLPDGARVTYVGSAGDRRYALPIFAAGDGPRAEAVDAGRAGDVALGVDAYYYRSSLCSTPEGRQACRAIEDRYRLVPVERRILPAIASQPWAPVDTPADVGLYRVGGPR